MPQTGAAKNAGAFLDNEQKVDENLAEFTKQRGCRIGDEMKFRKRMSNAELVRLRRIVKGIHIQLPNK